MPKRLLAIEHVTRDARQPVFANEGKAGFFGVERGIGHAWQFVGGFIGFD